MELEAKLRLSYYKELTAINETHAVTLVQQIETKRVYVRKKLQVYDLRVYRYLAAHPAPGLPRIAELIEDGDTLYVLEDYISGQSLREKLDESGSLCEAEARKIVEALCRILAPLHRLQPPIVHRDIKPGNCILTPEGRVVLVDFNAAKESGGAQPRDTVLIGTVGYAAPEQYGFSGSQPTADVYALGVLLNELLTGALPGVRPYTGSSGRLRRIIARCLQIDPANRYRDAGALLRALASGRAEGGASENTLRGWLPPGFRRGNAWAAGFAAIWYVLTVWMSLTLEVENAAAPERWLNRAFFFLTLFAETLWLGNYRDIWSVMPLTRSGRTSTRVWGVCLWSLLVPFLCISLMNVLIEAFGL